MFRPIALPYHRSTSLFMCSIHQAVWVRISFTQSLMLVILCIFLIMQLTNPNTFLELVASIRCHKNCLLFRSCLHLDLSITFTEVNQTNWPCLVLYDILWVAYRFRVKLHHMDQLPILYRCSLSCSSSLQLLLLNSELNLKAQ